MVFEDTDVSIQIFDFDFGAAIADAGGGEAIGAKDNLAAVRFSRRGSERHGGDGKVAVDAAVERLEAEIGRETAREEEVDVAVDGLEAGIFLGVSAERDFYGAFGGLGGAGARHAVEFDIAIDVARHEMAVDIAYDDAAFIDRADIDVDVAGDVEYEIHFHDVTVVVATALAAAAVFAIAAEGAVNIETEAAVGLRDVEVDLFVREGERVFRFGARVFIDDQFDLIAGAADDFDRAEDVVDFDGAMLAG